MHSTATPTWLKRATLTLLFSTAINSAAWAQSPQPTTPKLDPTLIAGTTARLIDTAGQESRTVRQSDPLWNGALIGAGVAIAGGLLLCTTTEPWENCRDDVGPMLRIGAVGAAIGAGIDALIRKRTTIAGPGSSELYAAPIIGRGTGGMRMSVRF